MQGHWNCDRPGTYDFLHDAVAAFLPDGNETVVAQKSTKGLTGELPTPGHARLRTA